MIMTVIVGFRAAAGAARAALARRTPLVHALIPVGLPVGPFSRTRRPEAGLCESLSLNPTKNKSIRVLEYDEEYGVTVAGGA